MQKKNTPITVTQKTALRKVQAPAATPNRHVALTPVIVKNATKPTNDIKVTQNVLNSPKPDRRILMKPRSDLGRRKLYKTATTIKVVRGTLSGLASAPAPINAYVARMPINTYVARTPITLKAVTADSSDDDDNSISNLTQSVHQNYLRRPQKKLDNTKTTGITKTYTSKVVRGVTDGTVTLIPASTYVARTPVNTATSITPVSTTPSPTPVNVALSGSTAKTTPSITPVNLDAAIAVMKRDISEATKKLDYLETDKTSRTIETSKAIKGETSFSSSDAATQITFSDDKHRDVYYSREAKIDKTTARPKEIKKMEKVVLPRKTTANVKTTEPKQQEQAIQAGKEASASGSIKAQMVSMAVNKAIALTSQKNAKKDEEARGIDLGVSRKMQEEVQKNAKRLAMYAGMLVAKKVVFPIFLALGGVVLKLLIVSAPILALGLLFGNAFEIVSIDGSVRDVDITEYVREAAEEFRVRFAQEVFEYAEQYLIANGGGYNFVRIYNSGFTDQVSHAINVDVNAILTNIFSVEQLTQIASPMFNAMLIMNYELSPSEEEATALINEILEATIRFEAQSLLTEWCTYDDHPTVPLDCEECGNNYADTDCPAASRGRHTEFTCSTCCSYEMPPRPTVTRIPPRPPGGTRTPTPSVTRAPTPTPAPIHTCTGYDYCLGHSVLGIVFFRDGLFALEHRYFHEPMEQLQAIENRTREEEQALQLLNDIYELYQEFLRMQNLNTGHVNLTDLTGVNFLEGDRPGHTGVAGMAIQFAQMNYTGGGTFWRWFPWPHRDEWCAMFVSYLWHANGIVDRPHFAWCPAGVDWFSERGQWFSGQWSPSAPFVPVAGDAIFFAYSGSAITNHVAIVVGVSECMSYIYIVDGNWMDRVHSRRISIHYPETYGFGLMNF